MAFGLEIKRLREDVPISVQKLADRVGIKADRLRKWEEKDLTPRVEDVQIIEAFFKMSLQDVMKLDSIKKFLIVPQGETYLEKRRNQKNTQGDPFMVPLVPVKAQAGYARRHDHSTFIDQLEMYPILPGIDPRGAVWRYFEIQGDSMEPALYDTDLVLVSQVPHEDWRDIKKGQVYVIVTHEDVFIKQVYPQDRETWVLRSTNKRQKDRLIKCEDIKEVWYYRRHVTNKIQWPK